MSTTFPILMFHRVADEEYMHTNGLILSGEHCPRKRFEMLLKKLKEKYDVWLLPEIINYYLDHDSLPDNIAAITFDDGTKDHLAIVLPLLLKYALTATFFVMSGPLQGLLPATFKMQLITGGVQGFSRAIESLVQNNYLGAAVIGDQTKECPRLLDRFHLLRIHEKFFK